MGCEYESLVVDRATRRTVTYDGPHGIRALLEYMAGRFKWEPYFEGEHLIALYRGHQSITLEPGGQFEMSGAPVATLREARAELDRHLEELGELEQEFPVHVEWYGLNPHQSVDAINWMPKGRYAIMRRYLPARGDRGLWMMGLTCTVQTNLDSPSEERFAANLRTGTAVGALVTALFANSPITNGQPNGYQSYRAHIWTRTDPDRCHLQRFVFETDCGYEDYVNWALQVPLFFLMRDRDYVELPHRLTFGELMAGKLRREEATLDDFKLHLSTLFPEVRARPHLEFRSCDVQPPSRIACCPALWKGLMYDKDATDAAWDLVKGLSFSERVDLAADVAKDAIRARRPSGRGTVGDLCRDLLAIAAEGLTRQAAAGLGEEGDVRYLAPLFDVIETGRTLADMTLAGTPLQD